MSVSSAILARALPLAFPHLMAGWLAGIPAVSAAPAATAVVARGETLGSIAARELGDEEARTELAALNSLSPDATPKPGTRLALPGPKRARALSAIRAAQSAMREANSEEGRKSGQIQLDRAFDALHAARYDESESLATSAREEISRPTTRVSVIVETATQETRFFVQSGTVEVSAAGASTIASAGYAVRAGGGAGPRVMRDAAPQSPSILEPAEGIQVAEATMRWQPAASAVRYRVVVARDAAFHERVFSADVDTGAITAPLEDGTWFWRVQAVDAGGAEGVPSLTRSFTLHRVPRTPTLNVGKPVFGK